MKRCDRCHEVIDRLSTCKRCELAVCDRCRACACCGQAKRGLCGVCLELDWQEVQVFVKGGR